MGFSFGDVASVATGGVLGYIGQQQTNRSNETIAKDATDANKQQSKEQMAFQREMSDTAHQREVKDLRAAGLNPILSRHSGASTPAGAAASAATTKLDSALGAGITGAKDAVTTKKGLEVQNEQLGLIQAQKANTTAATGKTLADQNKTNVETELIKKTAPGVIATSDMEAAQAGHYLNNKNYYNTVKMVGEGLGAASSAKGVLTNWGPSMKPSPKLQKNQMIINKKTGEILNER